MLRRTRWTLKILHYAHEACAVQHYTKSVLDEGSTDWDRIRCDLSGYDDSLISSLLIIAAVKASGIDQPVNVFFVKKLARHSISDSACRISKCDQARSVPACKEHAQHHQAKYLLGGEAPELKIAIPQYRCVGKRGAEVQERDVEFHVWNHRDKAVMSYFAAIKVQVVAATQWLFATIN